MYNDRKQAGEYLVKMLQGYKGTNSIVLAIPRGGVPVACPIAEKLQLPLELMMVKKIGHPTHPEFAIGAASLEDYFIDDQGIAPVYILQAVQSVRERLRASRNLFMGTRRPASLEGKNVILVDDGMATGHTVLAAIKLIRKSNPLKIIVAMPVASVSSIELLKDLTNELVIPLIPKDFNAVGQYYADFTQVSDNEVIDLLTRFRDAGKEKDS